MGLIRTVEGTNEDGSVRYNNSWTPLPGESTIHVVQTGPVAGSVSLADGTVYDVTPEHIQVSEVDAGRHAVEVAYHIAKIHESSGRLTTIVHGDDWTGTPATVQGDASNFTVVPGTEA